MTCANTTACTDTSGAVVNTPICLCNTVNCYDNMFYTSATSKCATHANCTSLTGIKAIACSCGNAFCTANQTCTAASITCANATA